MIAQDCNGLTGGISMKSSPNGMMAVNTHHSEFNPYVDNGGSTLAIAGADFCVVAADTRQSNGYIINCRTSPKAFKLAENAILATSGFHADGVEFFNVLSTKIKMYKYKHDRILDIKGIAQAASIQLYSHRFFPYYTFNIIGGLDADGHGAVYSFDPVGSFEREPFRAGGSAASLLQPFLDNQLGSGNSRHQPAPLTLKRAIAIAKDAFDAATERDIYTGDYVDIWVVTTAGVTVDRHPLKKD